MYQRFIQSRKSSLKMRILDFKKLLDSFVNEMGPSSLFSLKASV